MIDLKSMSLAELEAHKAEVEKHIKNYHDTRKAEELVGMIVSATKQLLEEYPHASYEMEVCCPDCDGCFDIDILEYLSKASARNFSIY